MYDNFPEKQFDIVLMDPPWQYYGSKTKDQACGKHYDCLSFNDLKKLPISQLDPELVFIWVTASKMEQGIQLLNHWNYNFRGVQFVWIKTTKSGKIINAQGIRPSIVKPTSEFIIAGTKSKKGRPFKLFSEKIPMNVLHHKGKHSEKPDIFQELISEMYPYQSKIELFSRRISDWSDWTHWGNEI
jgi:N6-adenosine-specific RNA methylase IME4